MSQRIRTIFCFFALASTPCIGQQGVTQPVIPTPAPVAPSPANGAPAAPRGSTDVDPNYIIGAADTLAITVWKEPNLSGSHIVRPDGMISVPLAGEVMAAGRTPLQLSDDLATQLKKFMKDPLVTISVQGINSKFIYLLGEIAHVGPMPLTPGMSALQAISAGGGLATFADAKHIYILRKVNGHEVKIPFNYKIAVKTGNMQGVELIAGDTIVVP